MWSVARKEYNIIHKKEKKKALAELLSSGCRHLFRPRPLFNFLFENAQYTRLTIVYCFVRVRRQTLNLTWPTHMHGRDTELQIMVIRAREGFRGENAIIRK